MEVKATHVAAATWDMTGAAGSERRWQAVFAASPVGIGIVDVRSRIIEANPALCTLLGRPLSEVIGHTSTEFTHPDDRSTRDANTPLIVGSADGVARVERRFIRPGGEVRWAWMTFARAPSPQGDVWTIGYVQDITERKASEEALASACSDLQAVAVVAQQIQAGDNVRQSIVDAGRQLAGAAYVSLVEPHPHLPMLEVTATTAPDLLGFTFPVDATAPTVVAYHTNRAVLVADAERDPSVPAANLTFSEAQSLYAVPVGSGRQVAAVLTVGWDHPITRLDDRRATVIALLADQAATALRQARLVADLEAFALTDSLTGLANRRGWNRIIDNALAAAAITGRPLTVALADLDHFKRFNDTHGHVAGDAFLRQTAVSMSEALRHGDTAARWGGEEFAFVLPDCPPTEAARVLERARACIPNRQTCSIGYATWNRAETAEGLMARADRALYKAKNTGRDSVHPPLSLIAERDPR